MSILIANETVKQSLHIAQSIARENLNASYSGPHLLRALMHVETGLQDMLRSMDKDPGYIIDWADVRIEACKKVMPYVEQPEEAECVETIMEAADDVRVALGLDEITPLCLLTALVKPHVAFSLEQLQSLPLRDHELLTVFNGNGYFSVSQTAGDTTVLPGEKEHSGQLTAIRKYCIDKTNLARNGSIDPIIGREREIRTLIEILGRRSKPNVIITGDPGVGKTALADGFAYEIIKGNVPLHLQNALLLELDTSALMVGASYKGELEDRLKKIITELKTLDKAILFIDEIHLLLDDKAGNIANLLKPELARGAITVIGATTHEEYRKVIEPEKAFNRRFEYLAIGEPAFQTCCKMVSLLAERYEKHHEVKLAADAIPECVRLSKRYIKDKKLPDAALDLLDRTMSAIRMLDEMSGDELANWKAQYELTKSSGFPGDQEKLDEYKWHYLLLKNSVSPILWGSLTEQPEVEHVNSLPAIEAMLEKICEELTAQAAIKRPHVGKQELAAVMAAKTGIPIGKIQAQEKDKLLYMEELLRKRVVGQDHALKTLSDAIIESRSGINKPGQPIGSFFLLGPTGTGKTELAKAVAELLFNDEKAMVRFDMSEFKEEHSAALLYGAPPGYIGYEEGGMLVNKIRQQPYTVVLFDEIEKAHPSVFDVFLQIMDEGKIHDKLGKEGDFSNALILFTSNIGSTQIIQHFEAGDIPAPDQLMQIMSGHFRPEFLARLTEIIPFAPITEAMAERIFKIQLKVLTEPLSRMGIQFDIAGDAIKELSENGFSTKYGARQIGGIIRSQLSRPVSKMIVREEVKKGNTIQVSLDEQHKLKWTIKS